MLLRGVALICLMTGAAFAQLPNFYNKVSRITWVAKNMDRVADGWAKLGLSGLQAYGDVTFQEAEYRGKSVTVTVGVTTGFLGEVAVDILSPAEGNDALNAFLTRHGDGVFAIVHEVSSMEEMKNEIARMKGLGVGVLQTLSVDGGSGPITFTYFDTEAQGKYVLGLVYWPGGSPAGYEKGKISQIAFVAKDPDAASAYWQKLGFPKMEKTQTVPRGMMYRGKPEKYPLDLWWQRHTQLAYEWTTPPAAGPSVYAEYAKKHGEGIQHLGVPVSDMEKTVAELEKAGYPVVQSGAWGEEGKKGSGRFAYMDTESVGGVNAELLWSFK